MIIPKFYTTIIKRKNDFGNRVSYGYFHIPNHREFYFVKKVEQQVEGWFRIRFWQTVDLQVFRVPTGMLPLIALFSDLDDSNVNVELLASYIKDMQKENEVQYEKAYKYANDVWSANDTERGNLAKASIKRYHDEMAYMWADMSDDELKSLKSFVDGGYYPMCRENNGSVKRYYLVGIFKDALTVTFVELVTNKSGTFMYNHGQFPIMRDFAKALVSASEKGDVAHD